MWNIHAKKENKESRKIKNTSEDTSFCSVAECMHRDRQCPSGLYKQCNKVNHLLKHLEAVKVKSKTPADLEHCETCFPHSPFCILTKVMRVFSRFSHPVHDLIDSTSLEGSVPVRNRISTNGFERQHKLSIHYTHSQNVPKLDFPQKKLVTFYYERHNYQKKTQ